MSEPTNAPFSLEAEEAVLGSILFDPQRFPQISAFLEAKDFFMVRHEYIWDAMSRVHERDGVIDQITLSEELDNMGHLSDIGGRAYLVHLVNNTPASIYAEVYGRVVERTAIRRKLMAMADEIREAALDENLTLDSVFKVTEKVNHIMSVEGRNEPLAIYDALSAYYDQLSVQLRDPEAARGIPTGFRDLDSILGGFKKGEMTILAGRPGMGKTAFALSTICNMARLGARVFVLTLEMNVGIFIQRMVANEAGVNLKKLLDANLTQQEVSRVTEAIARMANWKVWLWDKPGCTVPELAGRVKRINYEYGLDFIAVDYIQRMTDRRFVGNRVQEVAALSRGCADLAKDLNTPLLAVAQLSRAVEQRKDKRPMLSDLKESGDLEQDARAIMFLYRDEYYNEATIFPNQADVIVAKQNNGPTGTISLYFEKTLAKFTDATVHRVDLSSL